MKKLFCLLALMPLAWIACAQDTVWVSKPGMLKKTIEQQGLHDIIDLAIPMKAAGSKRPRTMKQATTCLPIPGWTPLSCPKALNVSANIASPAHMPSTKWSSTTAWRKLTLVPFKTQESPI